jgi:hypothetical protein
VHNGTRSRVPRRSSRVTSRGRAQNDAARQWDTEGYGRPARGGRPPKDVAALPRATPRLGGWLYARPGGSIIKPLSRNRSFADAARPDARAGVEDAVVTMPKAISASVATCPLCHTVHQSVPSELLQSGASWTCQRCGQTWTAARLETVAAYARYVAARSAH